MGEKRVLWVLRDDSLMHVLDVYTFSKGNRSSFALFGFMMEKISEMRVDKILRSKTAPNICVYL